jgi:hypothetical protein
MPSSKEARIGRKKSQKAQKIRAFLLRVLRLFAAIPFASSFVSFEPSRFSFLFASGFDFRRTA